MQGWRGCAVDPLPACWLIPGGVKNYDPLSFGEWPLWLASDHPPKNTQLNFCFLSLFSAVTSIRPLSFYSFLLLQSLCSNSLLQMRPKTASIYHCHQSIPFFCLLTLHPPIPITGCLFFYSYKCPMQLWIINFQQMGCWRVLGLASCPWLTGCFQHMVSLLLPGQMNET